jgi:hypothetical protein
MRRFHAWFPLLGVLLVVSAFTAGYEILVPPNHAPPGIALTNLSSVHQLQTRFNRDRGEPRLILIFSPT